MTSQGWAEQLTEGENSDTVGSVRYEQSMSPSLATAVSFRHLGSLWGWHNGDVIRAELGTGTEQELPVGTFTGPTGLS